MSGESPKISYIWHIRGKNLLECFAFILIATFIWIDSISLVISVCILMILILSVRLINIEYAYLRLLTDSKYATHLMQS